MKKILLFLICVLAVASFAAKAPTHRSIRAEAMGNAHVALVDDKEAIYFTMCLQKLVRHQDLPGGCRST